MFRKRGSLDQSPGYMPGARTFAVLAGIDSIFRAILISVFPVAMYRIYSDAQVVSKVYFIIGILSFVVTLIIPWVSRKIPRRWLYSGGVVAYIVSALICAWSDSGPFTLGLGLFTIASVVVFV